VSPSSISSVSLASPSFFIILWLKTTESPPVQPWARHERSSHELINPLWFFRDYQQPPYWSISSPYDIQITRFFFLKSLSVC
jgi:hypothetical protein